jgi:hypothetical protein
MAPTFQPVATLAPAAGLRCTTASSLLTTRGSQADDGSFSSGCRRVHGFMVRPISIPANPLVWGLASTNKGTK